MKSLFGTEKRADPWENPAIPLSSSALLNMLGGSPTDSGISVTEESSVNMSSVFRGYSLLNDDDGSATPRPCGCVRCAVFAIFVLHFVRYSPYHAPRLIVTMRVMHRMSTHDCFVLYLILALCFLAQCAPSSCS